MNATPTIIPFNTVLAAANGIDRGFDPSCAQQERRLLQSYPHSVILGLYYPQLDIAEYWCWQQFGAAWGECLQRHADPPPAPKRCRIATPRSAGIRIGTSKQTTTTATTNSSSPTAPIANAF